MPNEPGYDEAIAISVTALNSISLVSLILILGVYILNWKAISSFSMRLCFYLCLSCLGQSATAVILNPILTHDIETTSSDATSFCIFEGVLKTTFDLSSIIWTTLILYSVYASIHTGKSIEKLEILYLCIGFVLPIVSACIPIFFDEYGYNEYFCWFISDFSSTGFFLRLGYYFIPLWTLFIANIIFSGLTYKKLKEIEVPQNQLSVFKKILIFPFILLVTGLVATINTFHNYFSQNEIVWLHWTGMILESLYGFFTSIAYGFNPVIIERIKLCCLPDNHVSSRETFDSNLYRSYRSRLTTSGFNEVQAIELSSKFSNSKSSALGE